MNKWQLLVLISTIVAVFNFWTLLLPEASKVIAFICLAGIITGWIGDWHDNRKRK